MEDRIYDYWVATLQDGYIGNIVAIVEKAGGARALYEMPVNHMPEKLGITDRLAKYIDSQRDDISFIEDGYYRMEGKGINYVNHNDNDFPPKLNYILITCY